MSHKILDAVINSQYSQLVIYSRHNYNFKVKSIDDGYNALMIALQIADRKKRFKMFEFLLKQDVIDLLDVDKYGRDIYFHAVIKECESELNLLMKYFNMELDCSRMDVNGKTLLHYAVINNNLIVLETLLNYCAKYKINVDIPDKVNKITPYLLACRLNLNEASNLLVNIGRASKNQADQTVFYDAERWKQEGQLEKIRDYLKCTDKDKIVAQINGNFKVYRELCELSETLDSKALKNPEILPILTKVLNEQEGDEFDGHNFMKSKSKLSELSSIPPLKPVRSTNLPSYAESCMQSKSNQQHRYLRIKSATSSFFSSSAVSSSPTSSSVYWGSKRGVNLDQSSQQLTSQSEDLSNINSIFKETVNKVMKKKSSDISSVNTLLEMTSGQQTVDSFFGSKSDNEVCGNETSSGVGSSFMTGSIESVQSNSTMQPLSYGISQIFYTAALQQTKNYRSSVKYVEPVILEKVKLPVHKIKNTKSTLAIIREESRLGKMNSKKLVPIKNNNIKPLNLSKTNLKLIK